MWVEKHGKKWRIRDRIATEVATIAGGYDNKTAARQAMKLYEADALRGDLVLPSAAAITLDEWLDEWWPSYEKGLKPRAQDSEGGRVRNHIRPLLGRYRLDELDHLVIQDWVDSLSAGFDGMVGTRKRKPLAPKTVHNVHGVLHVILAGAVTARRIRFNPCAGTNLPRREHKEMRFLSDAEIVTLVSAMPEHWRPLIVLLVATGVRWGEAIGLRVRNLDLVNHRLRVVEQLQELDSGELVWTDPKTRQSCRTVSFPPKVSDLLVSLTANKKPDDAVFLTARGHLVRTHNFHRIWAKVTESLGLKGLRIHDLRHTHVAMLISAGRPLSAISRRLGHSSVLVTDSIYGHLREEAIKEIVAAVDQALAGIVFEDDGPDADVVDLPIGDLAAEVDDELDEAA